MTNGGRRGAALILGCGLLAGSIAAVISWFLPVQYVSLCQMRQRRDAVPMLESLDIPTGGSGMRAFMAEPAVRERVAAAPGLLRGLGLAETEANDARFRRFYEEHVSIAPFTDANAVVVLGRHEDSQMAARLANLAAEAGRRLFEEKVAERRAARRAERSAKITALEARVADLEARWKQRAAESTPLRLEAEMRVLVQAIEDLRAQDAPVVKDPDPWFVESPATPDQYRAPSGRWPAILACAALAAAFAALVWLARDAEPER